MASDVLSITVALCRSRVRLWRFVDICRIVSDEGESAALVFLSITVALCRSRVGARLWCFCRYLSYCVGRGGERGFGVFVDNCRIVSVKGRVRLWRFVVICRIMSDEGESAAMAFLSIFVVLCRSRWSEWLRMFCR